MPIPKKDSPTLNDLRPFMLRSVKENLDKHIRPEDPGIVGRTILRSQRGQHGFIKGRGTDTCGANDAGTRGRQGVQDAGIHIIM